MRHASTDSGKAAFMARAMVCAALHKVNKSRADGREPRVEWRRAFQPLAPAPRPVFVLRNPRHQADLAPVSADHRTVLYLLFIVLVGAALVGLIWLREHRLRERENAIRTLL